MALQAKDKAERDTVDRAHRHDLRPLAQRYTHTARPRRAVILIGLALCLASATLRAQDTCDTVVFVNRGADGANDGSTWTDAWTDLSVALDSIDGCARVFVAAGTYRPGTVRSATFNLAGGVEIFGGLAGTEDPDTFAPAERDLELFETILSGEVGMPGPSDNVYHIVTAVEVDASAVLDGFTINGARADGATSQGNDMGGGLLVIDGSPTVRNCRFVGNGAGWGGAIGCLGASSPRFVNCFIAGNTAASDGGGVFSVGRGSDISTPVFINCVFSANIATGGSGGGVCNTIGSRMTLANCTFSRNRALREGGGVFHEFGLLTVTNCILWGNEDGGGIDQSAQLGGGLPTVRYSCVEGLSGLLDTNHNIGEDPLFIDDAGADGTPGTADDNLRLPAGSTCVDAGLNAPPITGVLSDLDGNPRFVDHTDTINTGSPPGTAAMVDMGAYELQEPCDADAECNDDDACTTDHCDLDRNICIRESMDCDDGTFCNGAEECVDGQCQPGTPVDCDDGVDCTLDACNESLNACRHTPNRSLCDNGLYCDGIEACHPTAGCVAGTPADCDDTVACTTDRCDEASDSCVSSPDDGSCDDDLFCSGTETCDAVLGCQPGAPIECNDDIDCTTDSCDEFADACRFDANDDACDDGIYCNGAESCDLALGCRSGDEPCTAPLSCDEDADACVNCSTDDDCDDGDACTIDVCGAGTCSHESIAGCCAADEDCGDAVPCAQSECVFGSCVTTPAPDGDPCSDGLFCNGVETCQGGVCAEGPQPCAGGQVCDESGAACLPTSQCQANADCDDQNPCTDDTCVGGSCAHDANSAPCDDGVACTTGDACSGGACTGTPIPDCGDVTIADVFDDDGDGTANEEDQCRDTPPGEPVDADGCSCGQLDGDGDGVSDCEDECEDDPEKRSPGVCGCGRAETDRDEDGTPDCNDNCPDDPRKTSPGSCGCGTEDADSDDDGVADCIDECSDTDGESAIGANGCPLDPPAQQPAPDGDGDEDGDNGGGDSDGDGVSDEADLCPDTAPDEPVDEDGCADDTPPGQTDISGGRGLCGACGSAGMVSWSLLTLAMVGVKARRHRRSRLPQCLCAPRPAASTGATADMMPGSSVCSSNLLRTQWHVEGSIR